MSKNHFISSFSTKSSGFAKLFFTNPWFLTASLLFIGVKIATNIIMGANWGVAIRSGVLGIVFYIVGCYVIHLLSPGKKEKEPITAKPMNLVAALGCWALIQAVLTLYILYTNGVIAFRLPLWAGLNEAWRGIVSGWVGKSALITGTGFIGFPNLLIHAVVPFILLLVSRSALPKLFRGSRTLWPALPFVAVYTLAFVFMNLSAASAVTLAFVLIWPALGEEFFFRGVLQNSFIGALKNPVSAIVLTSVLFAATHIPSYYFANQSDVLRTFSSLLPVMMTSIFWGYGYYKTGVLWPWILIHALSDMAGF